MVFNYGHQYQVKAGQHQEIWTPSASYSGQNTGNYQMKLYKTVGMFGIVFYPAVFASLFRVSVNDTVDQRIALDDILGLEGKQLAQHMLDADSTEARVQIIERFLFQKLWLSKLHINKAEKAARIIEDRNGLVSIQNLLDEIGSSRRSLERKFTEKVGVSPKFYARIRRFAYVSYRLLYQKTSWQDIAYDAGYYDHSHFIKDFQFFNRQNPSAYLQHHQELVKYLR
jgi:AraC-like DNA-binding protein